jgi:hypothetical protein
MRHLEVVSMSSIGTDFAAAVFSAEDLGVSCARTRNHGPNASVQKTTSNLAEHVKTD